ncbi:hypothetical protein XENOCAPTIV_017000, partial [Xenoophorus captivus]
LELQPAAAAKSECFISVPSPSSSGEHTTGCPVLSAYLEVKSSVRLLWLLPNLSVKICTPTPSIATLYDQVRQADLEPHVWDPTVPVLYQVDRTRDGRSFTVRSVKAIQHGQPILICQASFQVLQPSPLQHQFPMPVVPQPEDLLTVEELIQREGNMKLHCCVAAYVSDYALLGTVLLPYSKYKARFIASLDHAMWFHSTFRSDEWMLYECVSPWAGQYVGLPQPLSVVYFPPQSSHT